MIDLQFFFYITFQSCVVSLIVVAVRMFFPPEKVTLMRVVKALATSIFVAVLVTYYALDQDWSQNKIVISILLGAFLADDVVHLLIKNGLAKILEKFK
ncbi:hypothetical protein C1S86_24280 [Vibrio parahaemolyticus]|nr:hypothetical protein C1S97_25200 [Vibrio parahaemolyticus]PMT79074.1 hypothetical protein C1S86_24280 [Vibrio parahaemolyticus]